jgi:hypothetical protein
MKPKNFLPVQQIQDRIFTIRGVQVMLDRNLAELYGVETKVLNQAVKRNSERFPNDFMFQLNKVELNNWRSQFVTSNNDKMGLRRPPYAFTEQGVSMLSTVLKSKTAIDISVAIIRAFVLMRNFISTNAGVFQRLNKVEQNQTVTNKKFEQLFKALENKSLKPKQGIFYDGQIFDAYTFVSDLIRTAEKSIVLIDNYVDDSVLTMLTKRKKRVKASIYSKKISLQLSLDLNKHNAQSPTIEIKEFKNAHDRFIIIDEKTIYHFGASLKDLGKKWFAFSKMDVEAIEMLNKLEVNN